MSLLKMAEYGGKGYESAKTNKDVSAMKNVQLRQQKVNVDINALSNHRGNRDEFIRSFSGLTSIVDGRSATFGEHMSTDKSRHSVNFIDDLQNSFMDASLFANFIEFFGSDEYNESRNTEKEILRTTPVTGGMIAATIGSIGAFVLESMMLGGIGSKIGGAKNGQVVSNWLRYGAQGTVLPMLQNFNEQAGLTQKYIGDNEIENDFLAAAMDGVHNVAGMIVGDKYLTPILGRAFGIQTFKNQKILQDTFREVKNSTGKTSIKDALSSARMTLEKVPAFKKEVELIMGKFKGGDIGSEVTEALRQGLAISMQKDLVKNTLLFASSDLVADYAFDLISHNALDVTLGLGTDDGLFSVAQNRMFGYDEMKAQGFGDAIISSLSQRLGMRVGSKMVSAAREAVGIKEADIKETTSLFGSAQSYDEVVGDGFSKSWANRAFIFAKGFMGEDFTKQMDLHLQKTNGEGLLDLALSTDSNKNMVSLVNSWYSHNYSSTKGLVGAFKMYDNLMEKNPDNRWNDEDISNHLFASNVDAKQHVLREAMKEVLKGEQFEIKDLEDKDLIPKLTDYILEDDFTNLSKASIIEMYQMENIKTKQSSTELDDATTLKESYVDSKGVDKKPKDYIDSKIATKIFETVGIISPNSKNGNEFITKFTGSIAKEIKRRVAEAYKNETDKFNSILEDGVSPRVLDKYKNFQISTVDVVNSIGLGTYVFEGKISGGERNDMKTRLEAIIGESNLIKGSITDEQKAASVDHLRGILSLIDEDLKKNNKNLDVLNKSIDAEEMMEVMIDISKQVLKSKSSNLKLDVDSYEAIRDMIENGAKETFRGYINLMKSVLTKENASDEYKQRVILSATLKAANLAKNVGYKWREEIKEFSKEVSKEKYQKVLREAGKNPRLFEVGKLSKHKESVANNPNFFNEMINDTMLEMHDIRVSVNRLYGMANAKTRVEDQITTILGTDQFTGISSKFQENNITRGNKELFFWDRKTDKAVIDNRNDAELIVLTDDSKINYRFSELFNHPNDLTKMNFSHQELVELYIAAKIKNVELDERIEDTVEGMIPSSIKKRNNEHHIVIEAGSTFRYNNEDDVRTLYKFVENVFNTRNDTRNMRRLLSINDSKETFNINGAILNHKNFFDKLKFKTNIPDFNVAGITNRIIHSSKGLTEATNKLVELLGALDSSLLDVKKRKGESLSNLDKVTILSRRYISQEAMNYATKKKINIVLRQEDGASVLKSADLQVQSSPIGNIGDRLNGEVEIIDIEFGEGVVFSDPKTLAHLKKANIIPLSKEFQNGLNPVWIRVKEMGSTTEFGDREKAYMRKTLIASMRDKLRSSAKGYDEANDEVLLGRDPVSFEENVLKMLLESKSFDQGKFEKIYDESIKYEQKRINDFVIKNSDKNAKGENIPRWETGGSKSFKEHKYPKGAIDKLASTIKDIQELAAGGVDFENKGKTQLQLDELVEAVEKLDGIENISNQKVGSILDRAKDIHESLKDKYEDVLKFMQYDEAIKQLDKDWNSRTKDAFDKTDLNKNIILKALGDAVGDTDAALKDAGDDMVKAKGNGAHEVRRMFYTFLAFNEAALSAKTLQKRLSYISAQNNVMKDGELPDATRKALAMHIKAMDDNEGKIYLTANNADGHNFVHRALLRIWQNTVGMSGGKYTNNASFGAKFMFDDIAELTKTTQQMHVVGEDSPRNIGMYDVLLDINSLKTLYPDLMDMIDIKQGYTKGNAIELNVGPLTSNGKVNAKAMRMLSGISLHTALMAKAGKNSPSLQINNLGNKYDQAMAQSIISKSVDSNLNKTFKQMSQQNLVTNSDTVNGMLRSYMRTNFSQGATVVAGKYNSLAKEDLTLYQDGELNSVTKSGAKIRPGAEAILGSKQLAEWAREYLSYGSFKNTQDKRDLKAYVEYLDSVSHYMIDGTSELIRATQTLRNTIRVKDGMTSTEVFQDAAFKTLSIISGKRKASASGSNMDEKDGFISAFDVKGKSLLESNSDDRKTVFAFNATRFPNHNDGQNTMVFLKGVSMGSERLAVKDSWYTKVFGGDWDGDTIQITARSKYDLQGAKASGVSVFGETDQQTIDAIFDWHYRAMDKTLVEKGATIIGDEKMGKMLNPGTTVVQLAAGKFMRGFMNLLDTEKNNILQSGRDLLVATSKNAPGDPMEEARISIQYDPDVRGNDNDIVIINPMMNSGGSSHKVVSHGAIKDIQSSDTFFLGGRQFKYQVGYLKDGNDFKSVSMLLELDDKDFGFKIVSANLGNSAVHKDNYYKDRARISQYIPTQVNELGRKFFDDESANDILLSKIVDHLDKKPGNTDIPAWRGKRATNVGIINRQAQSVGVDNVKGYGLWYIAQHFGDDTTNVMANLMRVVTLSTDLQIADINTTNGKTRLNAFKYKSSPLEKVKPLAVNPSDASIKQKADVELRNSRIREKDATQKENFFGATEKYIEGVVRHVEDGANGTYLKSSEYDAILALRKNITADVRSVLEAIHIIEKYEKRLFSNNKVMSTIDPEIVMIARFVQALKDNYRPFIQKALDYRADDTLKEKLGYDSELGLFHGITETEDETGKIKRINYYDQLLHLDSIEKTIETLVPMRGKQGAMAVYKGLLRAPASAGKNMASEESFINSLMDQINSERQDFNPSITKNVHFKSTDDLKHILADMGISFKMRTTKTAFYAAVKTVVDADGRTKYMDKSFNSLKEIDKESMESHYSLVFTDKKGDDMSIEDLYMKLRNATFDNKVEDRNEKALVIGKIVSNLSDSSQLAMSLLDKGATMSMVNKYLASEEEFGSVKHSISDLDNLAAHRKLSINDKLGIFDTAVSQKTADRISSQKLNVCN